MLYKSEMTARVTNVARTSGGSRDGWKRVEYDNYFWSMASPRPRKKVARRPSDCDWI
ncbi:hypothetical protein Bpfe_015560, partial [Biomphalaria pfeifferi]